MLADPDKELKYACGGVLKTTSKGTSILCKRRFKQKNHRTMHRNQSHPGQAFPEDD